LGDDDGAVNFGSGAKCDVATAIIAFYCALGERSAMAVQAAQAAGLGTACHIAGGIDAWKKAGGPVRH
jgi:rhodanese-related sulfurtransferase